MANSRNSRIEVRERPELGLSREALREFFQATEENECSWSSAVEDRDSNKKQIVSVLGPHDGLPSYSRFDRIPNICRRRRPRGRPRNLQCHRFISEPTADNRPAQLPEVQNEEVARYVHDQEGRFLASIFIISLIDYEIGN